MGLKGDIKEVIKDKVKDTAISVAAKATDKIIGNAEKLYLYYRWLRYSMVKKRTEAFFERGSLYQYRPEIVKADIPLYSTEDIDFATEEAERNDFSPFLLKKALKFLKRDELFLLLEIRRFRFDYCLLRVLVGDQVFGIILYNHMAMYPWELFKVLEE
jgi:hypothetical protein